MAYGTMQILNEWYGKSGLLARFYVAPQGNTLEYWLDFRGCRESTQLRFGYAKVNGRLICVVEGIQQQIPDKYAKEIAQWALAQGDNRPR